MSQSASSRIIRIVNICIAALVVAALVTVYWYGWRPLPQRSGTIGGNEIVSNLGANATVQFDARGVPHIHAASLDDVLFVQGYVTAQDRLWQMDALRRYSAGDLAEIIGPSALETDRESRRLRMRRIAENAYTRLTPEDRASLAAYTRGVNAFIETHRGSLPVEFTLLGYQPRPWSVVDSLLIGCHMFRTLTSSWRTEMSKRKLLAEGDPHKIDVLFPIRSGTEPAPGSNAWVVAGSLSASGKPLLSNDMHLEYSLPGIWYMAQLQAPGLDVSGVALPGLPGIVVGHNSRIAWGITNLEFDVQDLYIEKYDGRTNRYLYKGQMEPAGLDREIIRVKGQKAEEMTIPITRNGPLFLSDGATQMSLRWVLAEPGVMQVPLLDIDRARNWGEFTAALSRFGGPGSNFVYADVDGNIGYHAAGKLPIRHGYNGDVPVDGSSGNYEWDGYIPFEQLPSAFNPPGGIIATSNQNPFPANYPYAVNGTFSPPYRVNQVRARLCSRKGLRPEDMLQVQTDVYSAFGKFLAAQLVAAYEKRGMHVANLDPAIAMLRSWNGQMAIDSGAPFLIELAYQHMRSALLSAAAPNADVAYTYPMSPAVIEKLLRERPAGWFADYDQTLLRVLVDAVEEGERMEGHDQKRWRYGDYLRVTIAPPVVSHIPWIGKYFAIGPVPMSGSGLTVKQTTTRLAPSMRMDADLGNWDGSLLNVQIGESGQPLSSHFKDEWDAWYNGRSFPMEFNKVEAKSTLVFQAK
jgi:penicillin amidase